MEKDNLEKLQIIDISAVQRKGTYAIVGSSMLNGIDGKIILETAIKVRFFPGACIKDMYHYLIPNAEWSIDDTTVH